MKIISFFLILILLISCAQNDKKEKTADHQPASPSAADSTVTIDSSLSSYYQVNIDTLYCYSRPDSTSKTKGYVTKNETVVVHEKNGDFGHVSRLADSKQEPLGWIKLKYLTQIFFTPPKIAED